MGEARDGMAGSSAGCGGEAGAGETVLKAVFTTKIGSGYDDVLEERYHFPSTYLAQVENALGDSIVYYEPRRREEAATGGRQAYFAIARVIGVDEDRARPDHYYARLIDYLPLERPVPFRREQTYFEGGLRRDDGKTNKGAFGRAVRNLSDVEFEHILREGFLPGAFVMDVDDPLGLSGDLGEPPQGIPRPLIEITATRWFRDRAFARQIHDAYDRTCAATGLKIINGGGRAEVQAAHIQPVALEGSDSIRNGVALSSTIHWMFDRGLISIGSGYEILVSKKVPDSARRLLNPSGSLSLPRDRKRWPHEHYLRYHRDKVFKG